MDGDDGGHRAGADGALGAPAWLRAWRVSCEYDFLIVGAGFAGTVLAERLASQLDARVLLVDRRFHVAGNAYERVDAAGIVVHEYGPHIFHTNSETVFRYLSRFTRWRPYEHRVRASVNGRLVPMPVNLTTVNTIYGWRLTSSDLARHFATVAEPRAAVRNAEDAVVSRIGRDLYERLYRNYSRKQWGVDPSELHAAVTARLPVRTCTDDRYFTDRYQAMPAGGFTRLFERMLAHPRIDLQLGTDYRDVRRSARFRRVIFTGPIDEFFGWRFGRLAYRSLRFEHVTHRTESWQPVAVVNYPGGEAFTRVTEFKHLTAQRHSSTTIGYEYACDEGDPFYPVLSEASAARYAQYRAAAADTPGVHFVGRLGTYRYYNMDQVVAQALTTFRRLGLDRGPECDASSLPE
jgi:UDP-galactopyranose mutase